MKKILQKFDVSSRQDAIRLFWQFFKFGIVGVSNNIVALAVYYLFIWFHDSTLMALVGQTAGWFVGVANSFLWNWKFVFKESREIWWRALIKMYLGYGVGLLVALFLTYAQVEWLGISTLVVPLVNLAVTVPMNFMISKFWTFRKKG